MVFWCGFFCLPVCVFSFWFGLLRGGAVGGGVVLWVVLVLFVCGLFLVLCVDYGFWFFCLVFPSASQSLGSFSSHPKVGKSF